MEHKPEVCIVEVPSIVIVVETGLGYYTYPLLVVETKMNAEIRDWSSELAIKSSLTLGMAYYNSVLAVWEPLIEPNERLKSNGLTDYGPWELNCNLSIEKNGEENDEPKTKVAISSSDTLELTVSKTFIDVLGDLGKAFSDAIRPGGLNKPDMVAPYIVENETGFDITLNLKNGDLNLHSSHFPNASGSVNELNRSGVVFQVASADVDPDAITTCQISAGGKAYMEAKLSASLAKISAFGSLNEDTQKQMALHVQVSRMHPSISVKQYKG